MEWFARVTHVSGAVLAGGHSSRFGSDKFMFAIDGVSMGVRSVRTLREVCTTAVWLQGGTDEHAKAANAPLRSGNREGTGPLGALADAFEVAGDGVLVVLPCDVPQVEADDLRRLIHAITSDSQVAVAYSSQPDGSVDHHWLVSAWRTEVADVVQLAYERGVRSIHEVVRLLDVQLVHCEATSLRNFNEQTS